VPVKALAIGALVVLLMTVLVILGECRGILKGYKAAYEDYRSGQIDCVVKVKYPEWLKQEKE
jgi:hypothetical protein